MANGRKILSLERPLPGVGITYRNTPNQLILYLFFRAINFLNNDREDYPEKPCKKERKDENNVPFLKPSASGAALPSILRRLFQAPASALANSGTGLAAMQNPILFKCRIRDLTTAFGTSLHLFSHAQDLLPKT
jgi:hypothetical protein